MFKQFLRPGDTVIDAGANIGSYTVPMSQFVGPKGTVYAFEPQPFLASLLSSNLIENNCINARVLTAALGNETGAVTVPDMDYFSEYNFGGVSFSEEKERARNARSIRVPLVKLDDVVATKDLRLLKIDVENMELPCLLGAQNLITSFKPFIYLEYDRKDYAKDIVDLLEGWGYQCYLHKSRLFMKNNFKANTNNVFGNTICINLMCAPANVNLVGLERVTLS